MAHNLAEGVCHPFWEHEFLIPDYNKFADLTPADPVGDLRMATGGRLARSARYRALNAISDLEDELRATLHAGGRAWGKLQLNRYTGGAPFAEDDRVFLRAAAPLAGAALRRALLEEPAHTDPSRGRRPPLPEALQSTLEEFDQVDNMLALLTMAVMPDVTEVFLDAHRQRRRECGDNTRSRETHVLELATNRAEYSFTLEERSSHVSLLVDLSVEMTGGSRCLSLLTVQLGTLTAGCESCGMRCPASRLRALPSPVVVALAAVPVEPLPARPVPAPRTAAPAGRERALRVVAVTHARSRRSSSCVSGRA